MTFSRTLTVRSHPCGIIQELPNVLHTAGSSYTGKYYRIKDIQDIGTEWSMIDSDAEIQEFKDRRKSETEEIMTHGTFCKTWDRDRSILQRTQNREAKQARRNEYVPYRVREYLWVVNHRSPAEYLRDLRHLATTLRMFETGQLPRAVSSTLPRRLPSEVSFRIS